MEDVPVRKLKDIIFVDIEVKARGNRSDDDNNIGHRYCIMYSDEKLYFLRAALVDTIDNKYAPAKSKERYSHKSRSVARLVQSFAERDKAALSQCPEYIAEKVDYEEHRHTSEMAHLKLCSNVFVGFDDNAY